MNLDEETIRNLEFLKELRELLLRYNASIELEHGYYDEGSTVELCIDDKSIYESYIVDYKIISAEETSEMIARIEATDVPS